MFNEEIKELVVEVVVSVIVVVVCHMSWPRGPPESFSFGGENDRLKL